MCKLWFQITSGLELNGSEGVHGFYGEVQDFLG